MWRRAAAPAVAACVSLERCAVVAQRVWSQFARCVVFHGRTGRILRVSRTYAASLQAEGGLPTCGLGRLGGVRLSPPFRGRCAVHPSVVPFNISQVLCCFLVIHAAMGMGCWHADLITLQCCDRHVHRALVRGVAADEPACVCITAQNGNKRHMHARRGEGAVGCGRGHVRTNTAPGTPTAADSSASRRPRHACVRQQQQRQRHGPIPSQRRTRQDRAGTSGSDLRFVKEVSVTGTACTRLQPAATAASSSSRRMQCQSTHDATAPGACGVLKQHEQRLSHCAQLSLKLEHM